MVKNVTFSLLIKKMSMVFIPLIGREGPERKPYSDTSQSRSRTVVPRVSISNPELQAPLCLTTSSAMEERLWGRDCSSFRFLLRRLDVRFVTAGQGERWLLVRGWIQKDLASVDRYPPLDSDLSGRQSYPPFEQQGPGAHKYFGVFFTLNTAVFKSITINSQNLNLPSTIPATLYPTKQLPETRSLLTKNLESGKY